MSYQSILQCSRLAAVAIATLVCCAMPAAGQYSGAMGNTGDPATAQSSIAGRESSRAENAASGPKGMPSTPLNETAGVTGSEEAQPQNQAQSDHSKRSSTDSVSQTGTIMGTITDVNNMPIPGAVVTLEARDSGDVRSVTTNESGFFQFPAVEPGRPYQVVIRTAGFSEWDSTVITVDPGQSKILDVPNLRIEEVQTSITVTPANSDEIATEQVKTEEKQRGFGVIPNFYALYDSNPAPMNAQLKFRLAFRVAWDPFTLTGVALLAGVGQASDTPDFVQGAKGYGERFGVNYANSVTDIMLDGAILPSLFHQDPRYYYQGAGTARTRAAHVLSSLFVTRGDNGRLQPNYSGLGGDMASAAISNLYYPRANRGTGLVFEGFATTTAVHLAVRMLDEFVFRPAKGSVANEGVAAGLRLCCNLGIARHRSDTSDGSAASSVAAVLLRAP